MAVGARRMFVAALAFLAAAPALAREPVGDEPPELVRAVGPRRLELGVDVGVLLHRAGLQSVQLAGRVLVHVKDGVAVQVAGAWYPHPTLTTSQPLTSHWPWVVPSTVFWTMDASLALPVARGELQVVGRATTPLRVDAILGAGAVRSQDPSLPFGPSINPAIVSHVRPTLVLGAGVLVGPVKRVGLRIQLDDRMWTEPERLRHSPTLQATLSLFGG